MLMSETNQKEEPLPEGIKDEKGWHHTQATLYPFEAGSRNVSLFKYEAKHEVLEKGGVRFNAETVPKPLERHLNKPNIEREKLFFNLQTESAEFYGSEFSDQSGDYMTQYTNRVTVQREEVRLESVSLSDNSLVHIGGRSFFDCCVCAFAQHLPLSLSPDHIWAVISYAFAKHVDKNSEELRENFVKHEGKQRLFVKTKDNFQLSTPNKPDSGATSKEWEEEVFSQFSEQIKENIGDKVHGSIIASFSTTTPSSLAASEITLMSAVKNYFSFGMCTTCCGIPEFTLEGTEQDWISLRQRAEHLGELMTSKFSKYWMPLLLPVLDKFIEAYKGNVHHGFWQSMIKLRNTGGGSGSYSFISGWIQILFPYLKQDHLNLDLRPWDQMFYKGPRPEQIPKITSTTPVDWDYNGTKFDLHFNAGFSGFSQDKEGRLSPELGWFVTHVPEPPIKYKLIKAQKEIEDLLLGHKKEHKKGKIKINDKKKPWVVRVFELQKLEDEILENITKKEEYEYRGLKENRDKRNRLELV